MARRRVFLYGPEKEFPVTRMVRPYRAPLPRYELAEVDVVAIRMKVGLSQARFAHRFGFPVATLRHWEQGNRKPRGCALALLHVIAYHPAVATRAILRARSPTLFSLSLGHQQVRWCGSRGPGRGSI